MNALITPNDRVPLTVTRQDWLRFQAGMMSLYSLTPADTDVVSTNLVSELVCFTISKQKWNALMERSD